MEMRKETMPEKISLEILVCFELLRNELARSRKLPLYEQNVLSGPRASWRRVQDVPVW